MRFEDDGISPEMCRAAIESSEDPVLGVGETPLRLVTRVGVRLWCDDGDVACFAEGVGDVCAGVLVAWLWSLVAELIANGFKLVFDLLVSWVCGCRLLLVVVPLGRGRRLGLVWGTGLLWLTLFGRIVRLCYGAISFLAQTLMLRLLVVNVYSLQVFTETQIASCRCGTAEQDGALICWVISW